MNRLEKQFDIDVRFTRLMNSKEQYTAIMDIILKKKTKYKYGGSFILGDDTTDLTCLVDTGGPSHDIVWNGFVENVVSKKTIQSLYKTVDDYFIVNKPDYNKETIYFIGDVNGEGEYLDVHWNCFILCKGRLLWYDPKHEKEVIYGVNDLFNLDGYNSDEDEDYVYTSDTEDELEYNSDTDCSISESSNDAVILKTFDINKQLQIVNYFGKELVLIEPDECSQRIFHKGSLSTDIFCQSWVLLFVFAYVEKDMDNYLTKLDFKKYQSLILKQWLLYLFEQMGYEEIDYKEALMNVRLNIGDSKVVLRKIKSIPKSKLDVSILEFLFQSYSKVIDK